MSSSKRAPAGRRVARPETVGVNKTVELITLGGVRLLQHGVEEMSRLGPKHLALLVYLFHEQRPMQPLELAELLGRGREQEKELEAFGRIVQWIRKCVPSVNIRMTADTVEAIGGLRLDTTDVDAAIDRGDAAFVKSHYVGEFLEGFESGAAGFDEWAQRERGRIQRAWSQAILAAARRCENRGDWADAADWWSILVERSPMRPETAIGVIRTCAKAGRMEEAGRSYADYLVRLKERGINQPAPAVKKLVGAFPDVLKHAERWKQKLEENRPKNGSAMRPGAGSAAKGTKGSSERQASRGGGEGRPGAGGANDEGRRPIDLEIGDLVEPDSASEPPKPDPVEGKSAEEEDSAEVNPYLLEMWEQFSISAEPQKTPSPNGGSLGVGSETAGGRREGATRDAERVPVGRLEFMLPDGGTETVEELEDSPRLAPRRRTPDRELTNLARSTLEEEQLRKIAHQVTSVRKPWGPFLRRVWDDLEPWREYVANASMAAAVGVARASVVAFRFLGKAAAAVLRGMVTGLRRLGLLLARGGSGFVRLGGHGLRLLRAIGAVLLDGALFIPRSFAALGRRRQVARIARKAERARAQEAERARAQEAERARAQEAERARARAERQEAELERQRQETERRQRQEAERREREARLEGEREASAASRPPRPQKPLGEGAGAVGPPDRADDRVDAEDEFLSLVPDPAEHDEPLIPLPDEFLDERELGGFTDDPTTSGRDVGAVRAEYPVPGLGRESAQRTPKTAGRPRRVGAGLAAFAALFKRRWFAPIGLGAGGLVLISALLFTGVIGGVEDDLPSGLPDVRPPALPRVSLPKVSVPKVTIKTPDFVENPISRIGELLSGPLLEKSGQWVVLADIEADAERAGLASALTVALEADLWESRYFSLVPRERALATLRRAGGGAGADDSSGHVGTLSKADALKVARSAGYAAVVTGRLIRGAGSDSLNLLVLDPSGAEMYSLAAELPEEASALETLSGLARPLERRLGEPAALIEASHAGAQLLSRSRDALSRYADARAQLFQGRYDDAVRAAREAIAADSAFAMAYRTLAEAEALRGRRIQARAALETAWELSPRISEREQLRLLADRLAWDGLYTEAALTYDKLFKLYRDDAAALRALAIVQRMIGARGGGEGNLRIAYEIDPHDWPSLSRLATYLGYGGPLPDVDSLVASLETALEGAPSSSSGEAPGSGN